METVRFEEMGLSEEIQKAVRYMGFEEASPIQAKAIPAMISGIDLIGRHRPEPVRPQHSESRFWKR